MQYLELTVFVDMLEGCRILSFVLIVYTRIYIVSSLVVVISSYVVHFT